jgi:hypothetical protein
MQHFADKPAPENHISKLMETYLAVAQGYSGFGDFAPIVSIEALPVAPATPSSIQNCIPT